ncbi:MAG TPA: DinB family protein [Chryseolinea sp.]|nr:DinB family protein [Chryseolinea sp.]
MIDFIELLEYNVWANMRIISQVKDLAHENFVQEECAGNCLTSMRLALLHLLKADWVWLDLWRGRAIIDYPQTWDQLTIDDIEKVWNSLQLNIVEELQTIFPANADNDIQFSNGDEQIHVLKFYLTINLVVNHGTYYRGQIANMIETVGVDPVRTQLFDYYIRRIHA